ncbi:MAG TPA: PIN domain-containing protein [Geminicoccaceae bacterium]|nr:PIN domain-containing protein [Geminicoccaceae bacterium]
MSRLAFDSNVLIYAELEPASRKGTLARRLIEDHAGCSVVAAQALGELLTVVRRRLPEAFGECRAQVQDYIGAFSVVPTDSELIVAAATFAERYRLQIWDSLIWQASRKGGATILLTEDMQDGFAADGLRALNPFVRPDWPTLAADLGLAP